MKKLKYIFVFLTLGFFLNNLTAQTYNVPEILYYKFNTGTTTTPNYAVPGQGFANADLVNMTMGPGGQFDNALVGNAGTRDKYLLRHRLEYECWNIGLDNFTLDK